MDEMAADGETLEVAEAVHYIPVVFDGKGRLADQIFGKTLDSCCGRFNVAPDSGFTITDNALFGFHAGKHELADMEWDD